MWATTVLFEWSAGVSVGGGRVCGVGQAVGVSPVPNIKGDLVIKSLAGLKRALEPGVVVTLVRRANPPLSGGYDATGIPRRVVKAQSNAVAFESIVPGREQPSWLRWPKAAEVSFALEAPGAAQLFTVNGMTYRIETSRPGGSV